jgi:SAM-dependent methyltransferase
MTNEPAWRAANRANWDERVGVHMGPRGYDLGKLRAGKGVLDPIVEAALGDVAGRRVLHLQCHFGKDTLTLAQRGADMTGVDFSPAAIAVAHGLAEELRLPARFVLSDVYEAPAVLAEPASFDIVFASWGTICWLPDLLRWAGVIAHFLRPGGVLAFAEGHPAAAVFDDAVAGTEGRPGWSEPYLARTPMVVRDTHDYADPEARLANATTWQWLHPLGDFVAALLGAGLRLDMLAEHDGVAWRMFASHVRGEDGLWRWPDKPWLPLSYSLRAVRECRAAATPRSSPHRRGCRPR